jgi:hypothetical protein
MSSAARKNPETEATHDPDTGEMHDDPSRPRRRRRRERTPEEQAVCDERRAQRGRLLAAVEALSPALAAPGDPPVREGAPLIDVSCAREVAPLLRLPRASGQGGPGSALVASARDYDGASGGEPGSYVLACVEYHDGAGFKCRTRGVALRRGDLRPVAAALLAYADALDARDAATGDDAGR